MDTQKLIARLRERAATQDACGCWSLDRAVADELERLAKDNAYMLAHANYAVDYIVRADHQVADDHVANARVSLERALSELDFVAPRVTT